MGVRARQLAEENFSVAAMAERLVAAYQQVVSPLGQFNFEFLAKRGGCSLQS